MIVKEQLAVGALAEAGLELEPELIAVVVAAAAVVAVVVVVAPLQTAHLQILSFLLHGSQMVRNGSSLKNYPGYQCYESGSCCFLQEYSEQFETQKNCGW